MYEHLDQCQEIDYISIVGIYNRYFKHRTLGD